MIVKIKQGLLQGREDTSLTTGKVFYSFLGIPYAQPPVDELRFQPPLPAEGWAGIRNARHDRNRCLQANVPQLKDREPDESEDCLFLNVFTPNRPNSNSSLKPVMVHIHGGGYHFLSGTMDIISFDHLADYDVILVSFNYRLHIFGFLNLNTSSSAGNCGCKDQVLALRWIKENIQSFGGDPENVTIFGDSAGANAIHLLTISPLATGLFKKAIVESGTVIGPWLHEDQVEAGFQIGRKLGFTGTDAEKLVKFLKMQSAETLTREVEALITAKKTNAPFAIRGTVIFGPSIEKCTKGAGAFLPDYPINLISSCRQIPMIAGVAEKEGVTVLFGLEDYESLFAHLKCHFADLVASNVPCDLSKVPEIVDKVKEYYLRPLGNDATYEEIREKIVEIYSHLYFFNFYDVIERTTKSSAPLYVYQFGFVGELNESHHWSMNVPGALHADDAGYLTLSRKLYPNGVRLEEADRTLINNLCTAWTNFARTSDPNPLPDKNIRWSPYTSDDPSYLFFDAKCASIKGKIWDAGLKFWKRIFDDYVDWNESKNQIRRL